MRSAEADERAARDRGIGIYQIIQPLTIEMKVFDRYREAAKQGGEALRAFCSHEDNIPADDDDCMSGQLTILYDEHVDIAVTFTTKGFDGGEPGMLWIRTRTYEHGPGTACGVQD